MVISFEREGASEAGSSLWERHQSQAFSLVNWRDEDSQSRLRKQTQHVVEPASIKPRHRPAFSEATHSRTPWAVGRGFKTH
ncbi:MAG TPA: hypothetical protein QF564_28350 [Pirellulaceae bacterium]|nr:hypothetical protein [Pirellulaceae bacterium]